MRHTFITGLLLLLLGCQTKEQQETIENRVSLEVAPEMPTDIPEAPTVRQQLKGIWSNETSHDGVFEVTDTTFYYAENYVDYPYSLDENRITIHYPDYTYEAIISIVNDTLRMESEEQGVSIFWRYQQNH